jgi:aspartyl-tRNA synthetase
MKFRNVSDIMKGKGFNVFDDAESVLAICAPECSTYSRKDIDLLTDFVRKPQIGSKGLVYVKLNEDGSIKSSIDKFYSVEDIKKLSSQCNAKKGDLILILAGEKSQNLNAMSELRLLMGKKLELIDNNIFKPVWIIDFPLFIWDNETKRYHSVHHPFTSPVLDDLKTLKNEPEKVKANAYDLVINGVEIGGGSIRIHDRDLQEQIFKILGFSDKEANNQFGFLLDAFRYGTPPHGGIAFGFDRICSLFAGEESIKDFIAFPKNTSGKDVMIDSPSEISKDQLDELGIKLSD